MEVPTEKIPRVNSFLDQSAVGVKSRETNTDLPTSNCNKEQGGQKFWLEWILEWVQSE